MTLRKILASRDIPALFRWLKKAGYSQRTIGRLTKQNQSEVSEILKGRQVLSYDVLVRICDGLGVPRGWMGLAYDEFTPAVLARNSGAGPVEEEGEDVKRRKFMAATGLVLFSDADKPVFGQSGPTVEPPRAFAPLPKKVTKREVNALCTVTKEFRALGRAGNSGMPDILGAVTAEQERLLSVGVDSDETACNLRSALAELHTLAGWCAFDSMHLTNTAHWHYGRATTLAGQATNIRQVVSATWHAAIMWRDMGHPDDALKLLQMAEARGTGIIKPDMIATLYVASARAYALMGNADAAHRKLSQSLDLEPAKDRFDRANLDNVRAQTYMTLGRLGVAETHARRAVETYNDDNESREFAKAHIVLATIYVTAGEGRGSSLAKVAIDGVAELPSIRARSQLAPLEAALGRRMNSTDQDLAQRAHEIRCAA